MPEMQKEQQRKCKKITSVQWTRRVFTRVWLNRSWFMIHDSQQGFEFSQLDTLLSWAFSQQDKKIEINGITNRSVTFK